MIRSMTAFARKIIDNELGLLSWEVRAVNHRFLEIYVRLPEELRALESGVREEVSGMLKRGKIDCTAKFQANPAAGLEVVINRELAEQLVRAGQQVRGLFGEHGYLNVGDVLRWPGVVRTIETDEEKVRTHVLGALHAALVELDQARQREGEKLRQMIVRRLDGLERLLAQAQQRAPQVRQLFREKLQERLNEVQAEADHGRLEQEIVFAVQKMDVEEELDRLGMHAAEVRRILDDGGPVGRRLDFLMQELNREANTLGSKSPDVELTQLSVEMKVLVEQMREQVQNIE